MKLIITILKGEHIVSGRSLFGKADPYVVVTIDDKLIQKTSIVTGGGTDPQFNNEQLVFNLIGNETKFNVTVYDKQTTGGDKYLAEYNASMTQIIQSGIEDHVDLVDKHNKSEGKLYMTAVIEKEDLAKPIKQLVPTSSKLTLTVIKGEHIVSAKTLFGKADPYVVVTIDDKLMQKTSIVTGGGTDPQFNNEQLVFNLIGNETKFNVTVYDKQTTGDDKYLAEYNASMTQIIQSGIEDHVDLVDKHNKSEGKLYMTAVIEKIDLTKPLKPLPPASSSIEIFNATVSPAVITTSYPTQLKPEPDIIWPDPLDDDAKNVERNYQYEEGQVVVSQSGKICGLTKCKFFLLICVICIAGAPIAIGLGYFFGVEQKPSKTSPSTWIDSFPVFGLTIFSSMPKGLVPPPKASLRRGLLGGSCGSSPPNSFENENCAMEYTKDKFYDSDASIPGILTNSLKMVDNHIKKIKANVTSRSTVPSCFSTSVNNIKYEPELPRKNGSTYNFPMYFKCYATTDVGTIFIGEQDSIYYIIDIFPVTGNMIGTYIILDSKQKQYDLWLIVSAKTTRKNWALHAKGDLEDQSMLLTVAGTLDSDDGLGAGCGIILGADTKNILGRGIFEDSHKRFITDCAYSYSLGNDYQRWSSSKYHGTLCADANTLDSNNRYQTGACNSLNTTLNSLDPTVFSLLTYRDMSIFNDTSYDLLMNYKTSTLSSVMNINK